MLALSSQPVLCTISARSFKWSDTGARAGGRIRETDATEAAFDILWDAYPWFDTQGRARVELDDHIKPARYSRTGYARAIGEGFQGKLYLLSDVMTPTIC